MGAEEATKIAITAVGLDATSYRALAHFMLSVPEAIMLGNLDHYGGVDREIGRSLDRAHTSVCFIDYDPNTEQAIRLTERLRADHPGVYVFAISAASEPEAIIVAMRAGCAEYLLKPLQDERVLDGLARVETKQKERTRSRVRGKVVTLVGAKGGVGVTSLALHLALTLVEAGQRKCLLVDQHPALGDASLYLGLSHHQYSFYELASNTERLDQELLQGFVLHHDSGLDLLDAPDAVDGMHIAPPSAVQYTVSFLAETYEFVVIDCPPALTEVTAACIAESDQIAIVMTAEMPAVRNAVHYMEHLEKIAHSQSAIQVVVNRHSKKGPLSDERIEKALGREISVRVPNSYNEVIRTINTGIPIGGNSSQFLIAMQNWAQQIARGNETQNKKKAMAAAHSGGGVLALFGRQAAGES
jgi:pilus assembly protein CpaE